MLASGVFGKFDVIREVLERIKDEDEKYELIAILSSLEDYVDVLIEESHVLETIRAVLKD